MLEITATDVVRKVVHVVQTTRQTSRMVVGCVGASGISRAARRRNLEMVIRQFQRILHPW